LTLYFFIEKKCCYGVYYYKKMPKYHIRISEHHCSRYYSVNNKLEYDEKYIFAFLIAFWKTDAHTQA